MQLNDHRSNYKN